MDPDFSSNLEEIHGVIAEAEVFIVLFDRLDRRLLVDTRVAEGDPPMIRVVPHGLSRAERYRYLQSERPRMELPEQITVFSGPRQPRTMRDLGIWQRIEDRLVGLGGPELAAECEQAFNELLAAEHAELAAAILGGEGFETLWSRSSS